MYKVVLVEDEVFVRTSIKNMIPWEDINLSFCGEAQDGESALLLIQQVCPNILITDIKMPFMDGLQLSRTVKKNLPDIKIIILSGHDEFDFAQEALRIGVTEYILKPVRPEKLTEVLRKVAQQIDAELKEKEGIDALRKELGDNKIFARERYLNELSAGIMSLPEALDKAAGIGIDIIAGFYLVVNVEFGIQKEINGDHCKAGLGKIDVLVSNITRKYPDILSFRRSVHERVFILKDNEKGRLREKTDSLANYIKQLFAEYSDETSTIYLGSIRERIKGISESMNDADAAKDYTYVFKCDRVVDFEKISSGRNGNIEILKFDRSLLTEFLNFGDRNGIGEFLYRLLGFLAKPEMDSYLFIYYTYLDIVITTAKFISSLGGRAEAILTELADLEKSAIRIHTFNEFKTRVGEILDNALEYRDSKKNNKVNEIIAKTVKFIEENYSDPDISLITAANHVCVSPNYLSTIFSQSVGDTFSEYMTNIRIEQAKKLLKTTNMRTSEIAYAVGYSNPHYFSYIFKKVTGCTTKEFRK